MLTTRKLLLSGIVFLQALIIYFALAKQFPQSGDDYSYLYQAKLFATGKLYAEDPVYDTEHPLHDCVETSCLTDDHGRRFSRYPPGWPALLAIGAKLKVPWLVNPVLGALLLLLMIAFVEQRMGEELVGVTCLLMALCFFICYYAAFFRSHIASAVFVFGAFLIYETAERRQPVSKFWLFVAGALLGYSSLIRYIDCVPLGAWIGVSLLYRKRVTDLTLFAVGFGLLTSGNLFYNMLLSGDPLQNFKADHLTISRAGFAVTALRLANLIWVFPPALLLIIFWKRYRLSSDIRTYSALFFMNVAVYFFYTVAVGGPGPRYLLTYFPFLVLAVVDLYGWIRRNGSTAARYLWRFAIVGQIVGSLIFATVQGYTMYSRRDMERTVERSGLRKKIVFVKTGTYMTSVGDLTRNPPDLSSADNLYFSWCDEPKRSLLLKRFSDRTIFVYEYPGHIYPYSFFDNAR
jgi:hypothetical protein